MSRIFYLFFIDLNLYTITIKISMVLLKVPVSDKGNISQIYNTLILKLNVIIFLIKYLNLIKMFLYIYIELKY